MADLEYVLKGTATADLKNQEVNEPIWATDQFLESTRTINNDDTNIHEYHEQNPLRTNSGLLDFLTHVAEDIEQWIENETEAGAGHNYPRYGARKGSSYVDVWNRPAYSWRGVTFNVDDFEGATRIAEKRDDRLRITVTNWGPGILWLSADSAGLATGSPNQIQVQANASRTFYMCDEIWAVGAAKGTAQTIDVQDEYGYEY